MLPDLRLNSFDFYTAAVRPQGNRHATLLHSALGLFNGARRNSLVERAFHTLRGRTWRLLDLNAIPPGQIRGRCYGGIHCVNIGQICGSMGRTGDFDHDFHPLSDRLRDRWLSVAMARCQGIALPAVKLVQVRDCYFVEDGHHRLSVARAMGESAVDAEVTIWEVSGPLPWEQRAQQPAAARPALAPA
jgi:hypothetical protein